MTFNLSGNYTFVVTLTDVNGRSTTTSVSVTVVPTLSTIVLTPNTASIFTDAAQQFSVSGNDQFGAPIVNPTVNWTVSTGAGSVSNTGLYQAPGTPGSAVVTATGGSVSASASISVLVQLPAPTGLSAVDENNTEIDLFWTAPSGAVTGYNIFRGTSVGGESAIPLNSVPITGTTFLDTTVLAFTTYFYTVKAVNSGGGSAASNEANATTATDLALNQPVTASSVENGGTSPQYAVDGNSSTRWSTQFSDPQWIYVDLGSTYNISEVKLNWETAAGQNYLIQVSNVPSDDSADWTTIEDHHRQYDVRLARLPRPLGVRPVRAHLWRDPRHAVRLLAVGLQRLRQPVAGSADRPVCHCRRSLRDRSVVGRSHRRCYRV